MGEWISFGRRLTDLAAANPSAEAITFVRAEGESTVLTWFDYERRANQVARVLQPLLPPRPAKVVIALPTSLEHVVTAAAVWKLGGCVIPLSPRMPAAERAPLLTLAAPDVCIGDWPEAQLGGADLDRARTLPTDPLPDVVPRPGYAIASGGSTGRPKLIVDPRPWTQEVGGAVRYIPAAAHGSGPLVDLVAAPLHHNIGFLGVHRVWFAAHHVVLMERFDPELALELIERHHVTAFGAVPTMLQRMARRPEVVGRDLTSLRVLKTSGAACPAWVKQFWIDRIGADHVFEIWGSSERVGTTTIRGDEWLRRRGSVGRALDCELRILDDEGHPVAPGVVGEIHARPTSAEPIFAYIGAPAPKSTADGFVSVGDLGWLDADAFLHIADRRVDMIITGGANVYPAEVEAAISEHAEVADVAVTGVAHEDLGRVVHAVVELVPGSSTTTEELAAWCRERLSAHKCPRSIDIVARLPREETGKIRRSALVQ